MTVSSGMPSAPPGTVCDTAGAWGRVDRVGHVNAEADPVAARSAVDLVLEAGFGITLHGYIPKPADGENFAALYPTIAPLADLLKARGAGGIMTLHSYRSAETAREVSSERTVSYLRRLSAILAREGIPLRLASR